METICEHQSRARTCFTTIMSMLKYQVSIPPESRKRTRYYCTTKSASTEDQGGLSGMIPGDGKVSCDKK